MNTQLEHNTTETPLVLAFTANYLVPAATCILSVLDHAPTDAKFHIICLLTGPLTTEMENQLRGLSADRLRFTFCDLTDRLQGIYVDQRYTIAASYRLLLPELLPEYQKVIYLDCDIIIRQDLARLYQQIDLQTDYLGAVFEATLPFQEPYVRSLGLSPGEYINSGFLVMNLSLLRADRLVPKFLKAATRQGLQFPDQDVLNMLCRGRIQALSPVYNSIRTFLLPQYKSDFLTRYTLGEWLAVQKEGNIHYTGAKPWQTYTVAFREWWGYYFRLSADMQRYLQIKPAVRLLGRLLRVPFFGKGMSVIQAGYRKIKYAR